MGVLSKIVFIALLWFPFLVNAVDIVKYNPPHSAIDLRNTYPLQIVTASLEATRDSYGDYVIELSPVLLKRNRALQELHRGKLINIYSAPSTQLWEQSITPIYFPILKGLLNYRRFLINNTDATRFAQLESVEQLKKFRAGLGSQWSTTKILKSQGYKVVTSGSYEGLFGMLARYRFDYFIRGINEIYYEFAERTDKFPNMLIEKTKILHLPLPVFLFVSPSEPRLKERIEKGLWIIHKSGELDKIFNQYHKESVRRSHIKDKKVLHIENHLLTPHSIYSNPELWFDPKDY